MVAGERAGRVDGRGSERALAGRGAGTDRHCPPARGVGTAPGPPLVGVQGALLTSLVLAAVGIAAAAALYSGLAALGVPQTVNDVVSPVRGGSAVLTFPGFVGAAALLAALGAVLLSILAPLAAALYNVCASFTGGLKVLLVERG